jgi:dolichol-phosphate mannosyltransferase
VDCRLSVVVPTFNERKNVLELATRIEAALGPEGWEIVFVDDDSPDGTASVVRDLSKRDRRIRIVQRVGRRGLSSACIEGMLAASGDAVAVMDADLQHDESRLPHMLAAIEEQGAEIVVGTRYALGGSTGAWDAKRRGMSRIATAIASRILSQPLSDPMSGFFMVRRSVLEETVHRLSAIGFKILLDLVATADRPLKIAEVPYEFRPRRAGQSKLDSAVVWDFGMLLADKAVGRFVPVRFLSFAIVGGLGVLIHMAVLAPSLVWMTWPFVVGQSMATGAAMIFNFSLNNALTYRDRRLKGVRWWRGLASFVVVCGTGALANVGVASLLYERDTQWAVAALAGVAVGAVWNFAITQTYTWGATRH